MIPTYPTSLDLAAWMLAACGTRVRIRHAHRLPRQEGALFVVGNHRSFLDAPLLLWGLGRPLHFVCHHYLAQVPVLNSFVRRLGGFHLGQGGRGWARLFAEAGMYLRSGAPVVIFPEGAQLIAAEHGRGQGPASFRRGFAHLALRAGIPDLPVVPVAIVPHRLRQGPLVPLRLLSLFDASEPMFRRSGWHPYVLYDQVDLVIGEPRRLRAAEQRSYRHGRSGLVITSLVDELEQAMQQLDHEGRAAQW